MSQIKISNLMTAGNNIESTSFIEELQANDTAQIFGGKHRGGHGGHGGHDNDDYDDDGKGHGKGHGKGRGHGGH